MTSDLTTNAAEIRAGLVAEQTVAEWRAAMEGVTPGPWVWGMRYICERPAESGYRFLAQTPEGETAAEGSQWESNAAWVARCSPSGIASLLALIESLIKENAALSNGVSEIADQQQLIEQQAAEPSYHSRLDALCKQQAAELAEARANLAAQIAGHRHSAKEATTLLIERKARAKERDGIVASGEALVAALSRYGFPMSEEAWRNTGDDAPANSQASVEARDLHRAAEAFFREISGAHHE